MTTINTETKNSIPNTCTVTITVTGKIILTGEDAKNFDSSKFNLYDHTKGIKELTELKETEILVQEEEKDILFAPIESEKLMYMITGFVCDAETNPLTHSDFEAFKHMLFMIPEKHHMSRVRGKIMYANGNIYVGQINNRVQHGTGTLLKTQSIISGTWQGNTLVPNTKFRIFNKLGSLSGIWLPDEMQVKMESPHARYSGGMKCNNFNFLKHGTGTLCNIKSGSEISGKWHNDDLRFGKYQHNSQKYKGELKDLVPHGSGTSEWADKIVATNSYKTIRCSGKFNNGKFVNGCIDFEKPTKRPNRNPFISYEGECDGYIPNGKGRAVYEDGSKLSGEFKCGSVFDCEGIIQLDENSSMTGKFIRLDNDARKTLKGIGEVVYIISDTEFKGTVCKNNYFKKGRLVNSKCSFTGSFDHYLPVKGVLITPRYKYTGTIGKSAFGCIEWVNYSYNGSVETVMKTAEIKCPNGIIKSFVSCEVSPKGKGIVTFRGIDYQSSWCDGKLAHITTYVNHGSVNIPAKLNGVNDIKYSYEHGLIQSCNIKITKPIDVWTVDDVFAWVFENLKNKMHIYCMRIYEEKINGKALMQLDDNSHHLINIDKTTLILLLAARNEILFKPGGIGAKLTQNHFEKITK
jgi:hypothetical protein